MSVASTSETINITTQDVEVYEEPARPLQELSVQGDKMTMTDRWLLYVDTTTIPVVGAYEFTRVSLDALALRGYTPFTSLMNTHLGWRYKKFRLRFQFQAPKNLLGVLTISLWHAPYVDGPAPTAYEVVMTPNTVVVDVATPQDVEMTVPWGYVESFFPCRSGSNIRPQTQLTVLLHKWGINPVSTDLSPIQFRVYIKFDDLEFIMPISGPAGLTNRVTNQMHKSMDEGAQLGSLASLFAIGAKIFGQAHQSTQSDSDTKTSGINENYPNMFGNISTPLSESVNPVQLSLQLQERKQKKKKSVMFKTSLDVDKVHDITQFLKANPSMMDISSFNTLDWTYVAYPYVAGSTAWPTWLRYFSRFAEYWTGTIKFHFYFHSHPFIQTEVLLTLQYPTGGAAPGTSATESKYFVQILREVV